MLDITETHWQTISAFLLILAQLRHRRPRIGKIVIIIFVWRNPSLSLPLALVFELLPDETRTPIALALITAFTWPRVVITIIGTLVIIFTLIFFFVIAVIAFLIVVIAFIINSTTINPPMAHPSPTSSATEMNGKFLEGFTCPYELYIADSKMSGAGFGLFVRGEVPAGKEIFRVAVPAVSAVESAVEACDNCFAWVDSKDPFRTPIGLLVCTSCKTLRYCSKRCQRAAWKRYHKEECKIYCEINAHALKAKEINSATRILIRLVILHQHGRVTENQWQAILALQSHKASIEQSEELDWAAINADIRLVKEVTKDDMSETDLEDLYWRIKINQHSMDSPMQPQTGSCLVPGAALINHSCRPNAHHLSEGPELVVRSCRKIEKNEEITISYIDPTQCFEERQKVLFTTYAFTCQCCRCTDGSEGQVEMLTGDPILDDPIHLARSQLNTSLYALVDYNQELSSVEAKIRETFNSLSSRKPWPINFPPIPEIYVVLAKRFEDEQKLEKALHYWLKVVYVIDPLRYPDRLNMHRVEDLMSLSQLEGRISQTSETDSAVKATFHRIEASMSVAQYGHNIQLKEDAAASLGTNHVIYKIGAHFVEVMDKQMMASMGVTPSVWQSGPIKEKREERFKLSERELLKWAGIDLTAKIL